MRWVDPEWVAAALLVHPRMFWLDGAAAPVGSRRSIVGWLEPGDRSLALPAGADPFGPTQDLLAGLAAHERLVGWFGYAARPDLPAQRADGPVPDSLWMRASRYVVFDHDTRSAIPFGCEMPGVPQLDGPPAGTGLDVVATEPLAAYERAFAHVQDQLRRGNTYEVNLTYRHVVSCDEEPFTVYRRLRRLNPAPYAAYVQHDGVAVLSSSPEQFARIEDGWIQTRPIKGTTPRDPDPAQDAAQRARLGRDPKLRAENLIVTDLLRNDLSMVCRPGTVRVPDLMRVESYASVHQLVTTVRGRLSVDVAQAVRALMPAGSMTGAPKLRTMQVIADLESSPRGVYAGALGWMRSDAADLAVVIRTLVHDGSSWAAGTGGGITVGSDVDAERAEAELKLERLLAALSGC
ncbi:MAG: anthranilate synthase component I family protein [Nocardioidaceae bacterium]|jgi:anthranilate/para-aminobenzoate synthase component I|nr:anthranilate synthase component I family protein [Nocardioidaceae bacterium]